MRKCNDCNSDMIDGILYGKPKFIDVDHEIAKFYVNIKTGNKKTIFGIQTDEINQVELNVKICPKCGKVELSINPNDIKI